MWQLALAAPDFCLMDVLMGGVRRYFHSVSGAFHARTRPCTPFPGPDSTSGRLFSLKRRGILAQPGGRKTSAIEELQKVFRVVLKTGSDCFRLAHARFVTFSST